MQNIIDVNQFIRAFKASELGDLVQRGVYKQVGVLRTEYIRVEQATDSEAATITVLGRQTEAVIHDLHLQKLYAVEQYKGLAIRAEIRDEEMLESMKAMLPQLEDGDGFVYDQQVVLGQEELGEDAVRVPAGVEAVDGGL